MESLRPEASGGAQPCFHGILNYRSWYFLCRLIVNNNNNKNNNNNNNNVLLKKFTLRNFGTSVDKSNDSEKKRKISIEFTFRVFSVPVSFFCEKIGIWFRRFHAHKNRW